MKSWVVAAAVVLTAAVAVSPPASSREPLVLDVPYVHQEEALCGGAASAMVLRYWGERGIAAVDFAPLVEDSLGGIRAGRLVADLQGRGWQAIPFAGTKELLRHHLAAGRPVIALVEARPGRYHYVVLVAWRDDVVILHDPAMAPFRVVSTRDFDRTWSVTGRWSLLLLPAPDAVRPPRGTDSTGIVSEPGGSPDLVPGVSPGHPVVPPAGTVGSLVADGVRLGRAGELDAALARLQAASALSPESAVSWREQAAIRFRQGNWSRAGDLAARATRLDPDDVHAWRLLGASRYLDGHTEDALDAWNQVGEPRLDLTRIEGLTRTRFAIVSDRLGLKPGSLLTAQSFQRARRRLRDLPVIEGSRLDCRPLPGGIAEIDAAVLERPLFLNGPVGAVTLGLRTLVGEELAISIAGPTGGGERWEAAWRWEENRPRQRVAVSGPGVAGIPGIVGVEGFRERQTYAADLVTARTIGGTGLPPGTEVTATGTIREVRRRAGVSWSEWLGGSLRLEADLGLEQWEAKRSRYLESGLALDARPFGNTVTLRIQGARWFAPGRERSFFAGSVDAAWRSEAAGSRRVGVEVRIGYRATGEQAPPAIWPGAGTGRGRSGLLRAHPLLEDGVLRGTTFGRSLWSAGLEMDYRAWRLGPLRVGLAWFLDAARPGSLPSGRVGIPTQFDAGGGIRLAGLGADGALSLDAAHGLADGESALSLVWRSGRP